VAALTFRRLVADDLPLLYEWLMRPHIRRWWDDGETFEEIADHYLPDIEGREPTDVYVIQLEGRDAGFIQTYLVSDYPEYAELVGVGEGVAGVDLFLADPEDTGRGHGTEVLRTFLREVVFAPAGTTACVADPDVRNEPSLRAFEKVGFRAAGEFVDPEDGQLHRLVRIERDA
jgi:aminoglycoside 6'-N-acetyltransferase